MFRSLTHYRGLLGTYLRPQRYRVVLLAALLFGSIGIQLANPQIVRSFIDTTQAGGPAGALVLAAALFLAIALVQRILALATVYVGENVGWSATNALRADLARHCLRLDMPFHKRHTPGELIERIDGDVTQLANFFSQLVIRVLGNALLVLGVLLLLFREDWRLGLGLTIYALITFAVLGAIQRIAVGRWAASRQAEAEQFGFLEERLTGTEDIRAAGAEPYVMRRLYQLMRAGLEKERAARLVSNLTFLGTNALFTIGYALGLAIGAYLYSQGQVTIGTAYLVVYYIGMLSAPLEEIRMQIQDLQQASASIGRVEELLRIPRQVVETARAALPAGPLAVEFAGVSFGYEEHAEEPRTEEPRTDRTWNGGMAEAAEEPGTENRASEPQLLTLNSQLSILHDISFRLEPGQVLGLLGRTGSGKTSLTRLLFRLYDPRAGAIRLGGTDIRDVALADLRGRVGMVTQDVQLFQASIRDNLTFFDSRISDDRIARALGELGLWEWVQSLPNGLDTHLAAGGQGLSAGEAQLLAFTRVLLKNPGLVILDEASSRLDPATERLLERAVGRLLQHRTGIIIAHRLQTVQRADRIMILEGGRILEYGPRAQLADDPDSHFYRLLQTGLAIEEHAL